MQDLQKLCVVYLAVSYTHLDVYKRQMFILLLILLVRQLLKLFKIFNKSRSLFFVWIELNDWITCHCVNYYKLFAQEKYLSISYHYIFLLIHLLDFKGRQRVGSQVACSKLWVLNMVGFTIPVSYTHLDVYKRQQ